MDKLTHGDLHTLESYARIRAEFRADVMAHKRTRRAALGPHVTLHFEDRLTMHYQIQEVLRAERIFEPDEIAGELEAYNPLIPDGSNWKATLMIEYPDADERRAALGRMIGLERRVWVRVDGFDPVFAIADEDLERETEEKTSSVHFLRFELGAEMASAARGGAAISLGCDHPEYDHHLAPLPEPIRASLVADLS